MAGRASTSSTGSASPGPGETWFKRATAHAFYRLMERVAGKVQLPHDTGDFRLMSRRVLDPLLTCGNATGS